MITDRVLCPTCGAEQLHMREWRIVNTSQEGYDVEDIVTVARSVRRRVGEHGEQVGYRSGQLEIDF